MSDTSLPSSSQMDLDPSEERKQETPQSLTLDQCLDQIKDMTKIISKKDILQKKTEERLKDKVKQIKVFTTFFSSIFNEKADTIFDKDKKVLNYTAEQITQLHSEIYVEVKSIPKQISPEKPKQQLKDQTELLQLVKEENENLKIKFVEISQQFQIEQQRYQQLQQSTSRIKDDATMQQRAQQLEQTIRSLEEAMFEKDQEIKSMRLKQTDLDKNKAIQLIEAMKAKPLQSFSVTSSNADNMTEENQNLRQQLSDKTNKILEMNEKLESASETINALEDRINSLLSNQSEQQVIEPGKTEAHQSESELTVSVGEASADNHFRLKISDLEAQKQDVQESLEMYRQRARSLVMKKDIHIQKLKLIITKLESHLKLNLLQSQDCINRAAALTAGELNMIEESLKQLTAEISPFMITEDMQDTQVINHVDRQVQKQLGYQPPAPQQELILMNNIEYIRNVFVKYLEYLAQNNTKEITTIEHVLFTELSVTKEQSTRLNHLRSQNTFWKKYLQISGASSSQGLIKGKFSAGELKKKLFGGVMTMMHQQPAVSNTHRSSINTENYNDILNRSITSPPFQGQSQIIEGGILNITDGEKVDDLFDTMDENLKRTINKQ